MKKDLTGRQGERTAVVFLEKRGYTVVARNFSSRYGEIDIIATDAQYIVFIEVKTRAVTPMVTGAESVTEGKRSRLSATASIYLQRNPTELQPRFDVIEVERRRERYTVLNHIQNAF